jgi:hypothetical protein
VLKQRKIMEDVSVLLVFLQLLYLVSQSFFPVLWNNMVEGCSFPLASHMIAKELFPWIRDPQITTRLGQISLYIHCIKSSFIGTQPYSFIFILSMAISCRGGRIK